MPNGTGVSNIDLSRSPSHSLSPLRFHSALSLSFSSFPSLPPLHGARLRTTRGGVERGEGRKGSPGSPSQSPGAEDIHQSSKHTHMHPPTMRNFARTAALQPSNFTIFFFFHSILLRFRIGFASFYPLPIFLRKRTIPSLERKICISRCTWIRKDICFFLSSDTILR